MGTPLGRKVPTPQLGSIFVFFWSKQKGQGVTASRGEEGADNSRRHAPVRRRHNIKVQCWEKPETAEPVSGSKTPFAKSDFGIETSAKDLRLDLEKFE
jgi:hypothetical protein